MSTAIATSLSDLVAASRCTARWMNSALTRTDIPHFHKLVQSIGIEPP